MTIALDIDFNPYNSNNVITITNISYSASGGNYFQETVSWEPLFLTAGVYKTCSKISDGTRTRYFYSNSKISLIPEPFLFIILLIPPFLKGVRGI